MKEKITQEEVSYIANLAKLPVTEQEKKNLQKDLSQVIDFNMNLLDKVDTQNVEPTNPNVGISNSLRVDETEPGLTQEQALQNSKGLHNGFFKVEAVFGEADE